jgi:hypothetical protein
VLCIKVKLVLLLVDAHCLLVSKFMVQAGALLTLKKHNLTSLAAPSADNKSRLLAAFILVKTKQIDHSNNLF